MSGTHDHPAADPAIPWWLWACSTCHPEVYARVTAPPPGRSPRSYECPFCMSVVPTFENGRMRRHRDDARSCRGSELPPHIAEYLFGLVLHGQRRDFDPLTLPKVEKKFETPSAEGSLSGVIVHLCQERLRRQMTIRELANNIGTPISALAGWELGAGIRMDLLITWAEELGMALCIGKVPVKSGDQISLLLKALRTEQGYSLTEVRQRLGMKRETVARWERGGAMKARSEALCRYCILLESPITLKPL